MEQHSLVQDLAEEVGLVFEAALREVDDGGLSSIVFQQVRFADQHALAEWDWRPYRLERSVSGTIWLTVLSEEASLKAFRWAIEDGLEALLKGPVACEPLREADEIDGSGAASGSSQGESGPDMALYFGREEDGKPAAVFRATGTWFEQLGRIVSSEDAGAAARFEDLDVSVDDVVESENRRSTEALKRLHNIPLDLEVRLGQTRRYLHQIMQLRPGVVIELDRLAGEPVDIVVNQRPVAKGEVVVVDKHFAVRLTGLIQSDQREGR